MFVVRLTSLAFVLRLGSVAGFHFVQWPSVRVFGWSWALVLYGCHCLLLHLGLAGIVCSSL